MPGELICQFITLVNVVALLVVSICKCDSYFTIEIPFLLTEACAHRGEEEWAGKLGVREMHRSGTPKVTAYLRCFVSGPNRRSSYLHFK